MSDKAIAVGHIPSGLFVISIQDGDKKDGYLASWVQQVSFEPLVVAFTIKPDRPGYEAIKSGKPFAINTVGDHETQYLRYFWSGYGPDENPFSLIEHESGENGGLFIKGAKSSIECKYSDSLCPGDHEVFFAEVLSSKVHDEDAKPKVHIRKTGLDY